MNHFRLSADISKINWTSDEKGSIKDRLMLLNTIELQQELFEYCKTWKLAPWTFSQLKKHDVFLLLKDEIIELFRIEYDKVKVQNSNRNSIVFSVLESFIKNGIDVVVLKGNYLAHVVYQEVGYKRMNDFDILIHKKDWDRVQYIYLRMGFIPLGFGWGGEKEKPADYSHVGMAFISPDYSCIMGSQWGLKSPTSSYNVNMEDVWSSAIEFNFEGLKLKALSNEYTLLHLILHMGIYKCGIRDCMDVYNLILVKDIDQSKFLQIVKESKSLDKAYFTLSMSNLCVKTFSEDLMRKLIGSNRGYLKRRANKRIHSADISGDFQISYNDYFQDIEKDVIYFNLFSQFHLKFPFYLKILKKIYFSNSATRLKLSDKAHSPAIWNKLIGLFKAPYYIFSLIAQEIGWKFTVLLFLKLFVDLISSPINYIFKKESYFDYLKSRGIDPKEIANAVKNIQ